MAHLQKLSSEKEGYNQLILEKKKLEREKSTTISEHQTYSELLENFPEEKLKIERLQKASEERIYQFTGKLRAVEQVLAVL